MKKKYNNSYADKCINENCANRQAHRSGKCGECRKASCITCKKIINESMLSVGNRCSKCRAQSKHAIKKSPGNDLIFS